MASSPRYKLYSADQEYMGSAKYLEDAAAFVSILGEGATVRDGHTKSRIVWREGSEEFNAAESYDRAAEIMEARNAQRADSRIVCLKDQTEKGRVYP